MNGSFKIFLKKYALKKKLLPMYITIVIFIFINTTISWLRPKLQGEIIDELSMPNITTFAKFFSKLLIFLSMLLISYVLTYFQRYILVLASEEIAADLRQNIHDKLGKVKPSFFKNIKLSDILLKIDKDVSAIKQCGITSIITLFSNTAMLIVITPNMFLVHKGIALTNLILLICIPFISKLLGNLIQKYSKEVLQGYNSTTNVLNDAYNNWFAIRLFHGYEYMKLRYREKNIEYQKSINHQNLLYILNTLITIIIQFIGTVIIWVVGAQEVFQGNMTIGTIMVLMNYQAIITNPIIGISSFANDYHTAIVALKDIYTLFDYEEFPDNKLTINSKIATIDFDNVSYQYDIVEKPILNQINMHFEQGKIYAIIGNSGQGKSTLFKLMSAILEPVCGKILINGVVLDEYDLKKYWSKLGYVMQKSHFFEDKIIQNLNLTNIATLEKVEEICKDLDLYDEIIRTPNQWETVLKTEPANFSEGQLRRMDIARNILKDPEIIIFDEATSNIDKKRRDQFYNLLHKLAKNKIIIITTHNTDELIHADIVYKLVNQKIM